MVQQLASIKERWLLQHVIQMPLFAVLGLTVVWDAGLALWMAIVASVCWSIGAVAGAISLWRPAGWRVAVPLLISGVALGVGHVAPQGPLAGVMLATAAWQFLTRARQHARTVPAAVAA